MEIDDKYASNVSTNILFALRKLPKLVDSPSSETIEAFDGYRRVGINCFRPHYYEYDEKNFVLCDRAKDYFESLQENSEDRFKLLTEYSQFGHIPSSFHEAAVDFLMQLDPQSISQSQCQLAMILARRIELEAKGILKRKSKQIDALATGQSNQVQVISPNEKPQEEHNYRASSDFRSLVWFGERYSFTASQACVIRELLENYEKGTPYVGQETLLAKVDFESPPSRMVDLFRNNTAWNSLIVSGANSGGTKGTYRLKAPDQISKTRPNVNTPEIH